MMTVHLQWWLLLAISLSCWFLPHFFLSNFLEKNALHCKSCCDYVICWTMSNLSQSSYWLSLFFNIPLFFFPFFYMTASPIYLTLPCIVLSPSTVPSRILVFPSRSGSLFLLPFSFCIESCFWTSLLCNFARFAQFYFIVSSMIFTIK